MYSPLTPVVEFIHSDRQQFWQDAIRYPFEAGHSIPVALAQPDVKNFGKGACNRWFYYFEKGDLACQEKEWAKVSDLYDSAAGSIPGSVSE